MDSLYYGAVKQRGRTTQEQLFCHTTWSTLTTLNSIMTIDYFIIEE